MAGEKRDLLITIAKMYYRQGLSQEQIAEEVRLSRPTVSRMLKACVKEGIVQIRIDDISSYGISLGEKIRDKFGIEEAIIVPSGNNVEESKQNVAEAVARYLEMNLQNESLLGISWGTTLSKVVDNMGKSPAKKVDVIQMVGGLGKSMNDTDVTSITLRMAKALNGDYYILQAPFMVQSKVLRDLLLDEPQIREHFQRIHETKIAVVGLGTTEPELSAQFKSGHITYEDVQRRYLRELSGYQWKRMPDYSCGTYDFHHSSGFIRAPVCGRDRGGKTENGYYTGGAARKVHQRIDNG